MRCARRRRIPVRQQHLAPRETLDLRKATAVEQNLRVVGQDVGGPLEVHDDLAVRALLKQEGGRRVVPDAGKRIVRGTHGQQIEKAPGKRPVPIRHRLAEDLAILVGEQAMPGQKRGRGRGPWARRFDRFSGFRVVNLILEGRVEWSTTARLKDVRPRSMPGLKGQIRDGLLRPNLHDRTIPSRTDRKSAMPTFNSRRLSNVSVDSRGCGIALPGRVVPNRRDPVSDSQHRRAVILSVPRAPPSIGSERAPPRQRRASHWTCLAGPTPM